ncbi:MAG: hypothetical protein WCP20_23360 [Desulfuromonadales bacterium]
MATTYRDKIIDEIDSIPDAFLPDVYQVLHILKTRFLPNEAGTKSRKSLEGIWQGAVIEEEDFAEARRSLFSYEYRL